MIRSGAAPGDGMFYDAQQRPSSPPPRFVRAFELCRQVRREGLDGGVEVWRNDWAESLKARPARHRDVGLLDGRPVGQLGGPETRGLWRSAPLPEQTYVSYGGTYYVIPRRSDPARKAPRLVTDPDHDAGPPAPARHLPRARRLPCPAGRAGGPVLRRGPCPSSVASVPACCGATWPARFARRPCTARPPLRKR